MTRRHALLVALLLSGCAGRTVPAPPSPSASTAAPAVRPTPPHVHSTVVVDYRIEVRATHGVADFARVVEATLSDARGWQRADFRLRRTANARFVVVVAEGDVVDRLCLPYDTYGEYSCQNGPVVALNAERWREGTPEWTGDLATYRQMLVNHEVGHLLGQHHPAQQCPQPGRPAAVMSQQSTELRGCLPNPWPLDWEIVLASRHAEPLAPPYEKE